MFPNRLIVHACHKSGSMALFKYFSALSKLLAVDLYSANGNRSKDPSLFLDNISLHGILSPHRKYEPLQNQNATHIIHTRHPLDILVSRYYSFGYTHITTTYAQVKKKKEIQELSIDEYCFQAASELKSRFAPLLSIHPDQTSMITSSYSDMVCAFEQWNQYLCTNLGISETLTSKMYHRVSSEFDVPKELTLDQMKKGIARHKRKMLPGDHLEKLKKNNN